MKIRTVKLIRSAILLVLMQIPLGISASTGEAASFSANAQGFEALKKTVPERLAMKGIVLGIRGTADLNLKRYDAFARSASFLVGNSAGDVSRVSLRSTTYYRGFVSGFEGSFAFLSVDVNSGELSGSVELEGSLWNLRLDKNGQQFIAIEVPRSRRNIPLDLGKDYEEPLITNPPHSKFSSNEMKSDRIVIPRSKLELYGANVIEGQNFTEYNCNTDLFEQYNTVGWTIDSGTACVTSFEIPHGYSGRFTVAGKDGNEGNADLYVRRGNPSVIECESAGETTDEVCSDIASGVVEVVVTAPDTDVSYWLSYVKKNLTMGTYERRCSSPELNDSRSWDIDAGESCVFEFDIPEGTTGTFTLWGRAGNTGNADLLVRRGSPSSVVCSSQDSGVNEYCDGIESGPVEVVVSAPTDSVNISLDYALAIPELTEGFQYEAVVAVDLDYQIYQDLGSLESVQNYLAEIFAYTNVPFEQEIETHLVIGDIRVRQTADDDPYHVDEELSTACRLAELESKWMGSEALSSVERSTVAHLTSFPFGGVAVRGGLCMDPVTYSSPQEVENCPFDNLGTGGFSVSGRQEVVSTIGEGPAFADLVVAHELGHNFNSQHSHGYMGFGGNANPVDACYVEDNQTSSYWAGDTGLPGVGSLEGGVSGERTGTIMSYCHQLPGGTSGNQSMTFGKGFAYGVEPERVPERMRNFVGALALTSPSCIATVSTIVDSDGDGFADTEDAFPNDPNEWLDTDSDGIGDNADTDDDNDGVEDDFDVFPNDAEEWLDSDGDGIGDNADVEYDPVSVSTFSLLNRTDRCSVMRTLVFEVDGRPATPLAPGERLRTTLADGAHVITFSDSAGDELGRKLLNVPSYKSWGWGCNWEGWSLEDFEVVEDSDGDLVADLYDDFPLDRSESVDTDGDGIGNNADTDDDNDGFSDEDEINAGTDPLDASSRPRSNSRSNPGIPTWLLYETSKQSDLSVEISASGDDGYELYLDGQLLIEDFDWKVATRRVVSLERGRHVVAIKGINAADGVDVGAIIVDIAGPDFRVVSNSDWEVSLDAGNTWNKLNGSLPLSMPATEYGAVDSRRWWNRDGTDNTGATLEGANFPLDSPAKWIWSEGFRTDGVVYFRKEFVVE